MVLLKAGVHALAVHAAGLRGVLRAQAPPALAHARPPWRRHLALLPPQRKAVRQNTALGAAVEPQ